MNLERSKISKFCLFSLRHFLISNLVRNSNHINMLMSFPSNCNDYLFGEMLDYLNYKVSLNIWLSLLKEVIYNNDFTLEESVYICLRGIHRVATGFYHGNALKLLLIIPYKTEYYVHDKLRYALGNLRIRDHVITKYVSESLMLETILFRNVINIIIIGGLTQSRLNSIHRLLFYHYKLTKYHIPIIDLACRLNNVNGISWKHLWFLRRAYVHSQLFKAHPRDLSTPYSLSSVCINDASGIYSKIAQFTYNYQNNQSSLKGKKHLNAFLIKCTGCHPNLILFNIDSSKSFNKNEYLGCIELMSTGTLDSEIFIDSRLYFNSVLPYRVDDTLFFDATSLLVIQDIPINIEKNLSIYLANVSNSFSNYKQRNFWIHDQEDELDDFTECKKLSLVPSSFTDDSRIEENYTNAQCAVFDFLIWSYMATR